MCMYGEAFQHFFTGGVDSKLVALKILNFAKQIGGRCQRQLSAVISTSFVVYVNVISIKNISLVAHHEFAYG